MTEQMKPSGIAWIGSIPLAWDTKRIKYVISDIKDGTHGTFDRVESGEPLLSAKNVFDDGIRIRNNESEISYSDYSSIVSNGFPRKNDVLLCCVGTIGRCCIYEFDKPKAFQRSVSFLRPLSSTSARFLKYALQSDSTLVQEQLLLNKSAQEGLYMGSVREMVIALPNSYHIQESIADFLDAKCTKIDGIIADIEKQIETLQKYKKSLITETVTNGLDKSAPIKDSGIEWIGNIPNKWEIQRIKDIAKMQTGTTPPNNEGVNYDDEGLPWFTPADFTDGSIVLHKAEKHITKGIITQESLKIFPPHSILFVGIASVGKIGYYSELCYSNQQITAIKPKNITTSKYIAYALLASMEYTKSNALYTTVPIINNAYLGTIKIPFPSVKEQNEIICYLDKKCQKIDEIVASKISNLEILQQHKKSLIYEYVTGKKRVTEVN